MVIAHRIFCVRSATDKLIFPDEEKYKMRLFLFTLFGIIIIYYFKLTPNFHLYFLKNWFLQFGKLPNILRG
jgi:hypothetical protein